MKRIIIMMSMLMTLLLLRGFESRQLYRVFLLWGIFELISLGMARAEVPYDPAWMRQIGTSGEDRSYAVSTDSSGNVYISGITDGILDNINAGSNDAFLIKYDTSGNRLWSRQIGSTGIDESYSMAVDASGNIYISGLTTGNLGGGPIGGGDAFLVKYDSSGTHLWSQKIGTSSYDGSFATATDASGNIYISGRTDGKIVSSAEGRDAFLTKFNGSGTKLWSQQIGTNGWDESNAVATDAAGNVYISGYTTKSLGGISAGGYDAFVVKYAQTGTKVWSQQIGTSGEDRSNAVAVDISGHIYISGYTSGNLDGNNAGGTDAFLTKYDPNGMLLWSRQLGTAGDDKSYSVAVDSSNNIYISGSVTGNLDGIGSGGEDTFLACYDTHGTLLWSRQIGTSGSDVSRCAAIDTLDNGISAATPMTVSTEQAQAALTLF